MSDTADSRSSGYAPSLLVDVLEAAHLLSVGERTVWALVERGELPRVRLGRRITRFRRSDVADLVRRRTEDGLPFDR